MPHIAVGLTARGFGAYMRGYPASPPSLRPSSGPSTGVAASSAGGTSVLIASMTSMRKALSELILSARTGRPSDDVVSQTAETLVMVAKRDGLQPEQLIVTLKHEWLEISGSRRAAADDGLRETQERLISECIRSFYR